MRPSGSNLASLLSGLLLVSVFAVCFVRVLAGGEQQVARVVRLGP